MALLQSRIDFLKDAIKADKEKLLTDISAERRKDLCQIMARHKEELEYREEMHGKQNL